MEHSRFAHLHVHSEYSLLDGACRLPQLMRKAHECKMPALALTDHGNLFGAIQFYTQALDSGIKPIIGYEAYIAPGSRFDRTAHSIKDASSHLTVLVKDETGYKNLMKLATLAYFEGFYYKPRIDREALDELKEGLIVLSGCLKGEIPHLIQNDLFEQAQKVAGEYKDMLGDGNFYLEVQDHGIVDQRKVTEGLLRISRDLEIPLVATNDCHYIEQSDSEAHGVLLCIQTGSTINDPGRMKFSTDNFYFRSTKEMEKLFSSVPGAILNTIDIAEKCNLELSFVENLMARFAVPEGKTPESYLEQLCREGLKARFGSANKKALERIEHELSVIKQTGYTSYFLIVWDVVRYAKENGFRVGPGRGSVVGSMVAYVLGITEVDPVRYGLIFERFLNSARAGDFDIDFCDENRSAIIEYVTAKYGTENVAQIITFGTMAARGVIRDVGRVLDIPYGEVDRIAKLVPNEPDINLDGAMDREPELREIAKRDEKVKRLLSIAKSLEGLTRHASTHAAGIVISDKKLTDYVPLLKGRDGEILTQFPMESLEKVGLIKTDFLGLKTLSVIQKTLQNIEKTHGKKISIEEVPFDDLKTLELLREGKTLGVFQLESSGMRDILRKLEPQKFEDIIAVVGLYRPGPLGSGMVKEFINRKHKLTSIQFDHPALEPILTDTYGVILYQEQIMRIASKLAGFSLEQGDILQKAISKKIPEVMERQRGFFVDGAVKNGVKKEVANKVFDLVTHFAGYGFNKAHATAYAMIAYQTAYLKAHYLREFLSALLSSEMDNTDKLVTYIGECESFGVKVLPPDVNESQGRFQVTEEGIRFGLVAVKNVGASAIDSIVHTRDEKGKFTSLYDFCERVDLRLVNKRVVESLVKCGAFDCLGATRSQLFAAIDDAIGVGQRLQKDRLSGQFSLFDTESDFGEYPQIPEWHEGELLSFEKQVLGFYVSGHPLARYEKLVKTYSTASSIGLHELEDGAYVGVAGIVTGIKRITTKKGNRMAYVQLEDLEGTGEVIFFPNSLEEYAALLKQDALIYVRGTVDSRQDVAKVVAKEVIPLSEVEKHLAKSAHIKLIITGLEEETLLSLKEVLLSYPGNCSVYFDLKNGPHREIILGGNPELRIEPGQELMKKVEELVGEGSVSFKP